MKHRRSVFVNEIMFSDIGAYKRFVESNLKAIHSVRVMPPKLGDKGFGRVKVILNSTTVATDGKKQQRWSKGQTVIRKSRAHSSR